MKRILTFAALLAVLGLMAGCSLKKEDDPEALLRSYAQQGETIAEEAGAAVTPAPVKAAVSTAGAEKKGAHGISYTAQKETLFSSSSFTIQSEGVQKTAEGDDALLLSWKNTGDKNLIALLEDVVVNGYAIDPFFAAGAEAHASGEGTVLFLKELTAPLGLDYIDEIRFTLTVCPEDAVYTDYLAHESLTLFPTALNGETVYVPAAPHINGEEEFLNAGGLVFLVYGPDESYETSEDYALVLSVFLENAGDAPLTFSLDGVTVNGESIDPYWAELVPAKARQLSKIYFTREEFEKHGLTAFDAMEFVLRINDEDYNTVKEVSGTYKPLGK